MKQSLTAGMADDRVLTRKECWDLIKIKKPKASP